MSQPLPQPAVVNAHNLSHNHPPMVVSDAVLRRRSADVGGLQLAMRGESQGQGWLDSTGCDTNIATEYAEVCATMYRETLRLVENNVAQNDLPQLSHADRVRLLQSLESWYFEPLHMPEHELLACVQFLFQVLFRIEGMSDAINLDMNVIPRFIVHIRQLYRWQNHYHNFEHAVDVLQAIHCYLRSAGMVPSVSLLLTDADAPGGMWSSAREHDSGPLVTCLTPHEIFALYLAAIGHDVGHPGFNNPFMKNADTPLSRVYDNQSALEQMHSYLLLMAMRQYGLGSLLDDPKSGFLFRKILKSSVLATDMGIHQAFMNQSEEVLDGVDPSTGIVKWQSTKCTRQVFICQLLLKNADISNPCRPFLVSKQWASALQQEWACQYKFENFLEVQHSVNPSNGPLAEANSQVFFTERIAKPLVDMTTLAIPELKQYSYHCAENLREWERILEEQKQALVAIDSVSKTSSTSESSTNPSSSTLSTSSPQASSLSSSASPTRQDFNTSSTATPNIPPYTNRQLSGHTSPSPSSHISPTPVSTTTSISTTSSSLSSISSSFNSVSPRITNSGNDYSTAFRLTLPRGSSMSMNVSPAVTPGSVLSVTGNVGARGRVGRTVSSGSGISGAASPGGSSTGVLSPSLSRAAARVVSGGIVYRGSAVGGSPFSSSSSPSPPHLTATSSPRSPPDGQSSSEDRTKMDGYRFPPFSPTSSLMSPTPFTPTDPTASTSRHPQLRNKNYISQPHSQTHSSTPSVSPSDSHSQFPEDDAVDDAPDQERSHLPTDGVIEGDSSDDPAATGEMAEDEYEIDVQVHRANFHHAVGLGLGVGSLKRKHSTNVLRSLPFGYSPSPTPSASATASASPSTGGGYSSLGGGAASPPSSSSTPSSNTHSSPAGSQGRSFRMSRQHNPNRASWCPGESWVFDVLEPEVRSKEEARGTIEGWTRGRWGSASFGVPLSDTDANSGVGGGQGSEYTADKERGRGERHPRDHEIEMSNSIPTGLVSAAPPLLASSSSESDPRTPPQQTGSLDDRSGSPTPKAKPPPEPQLKPRESEGQKKRRQEKERQKIIDELIRDEEKEKRKVMKRAASMNFLNIGGNSSSSVPEKDARSRSRSRKKGKGRK